MKIFVTYVKCRTVDNIQASTLENTCIEVWIFLQKVISIRKFTIFDLECGVTDIVSPLEEHICSIVPSVASQSYIHQCNCNSKRSLTKHYHQTSGTTYLPSIVIPVEFWMSYCRPITKHRVTNTYMMNVRNCWT